MAAPKKSRSTSKKTTQPEVPSEVVEEVIKEVVEEVVPEQPEATGEPNDVREEETPVVEEVELADVNAVSEYLTRPGININDKLVALSKTGPLSVRSAVSSLLAYLEEGGADTPDRDPEYVLGKIYNLYNVIKSIIETPDASEFKVKMDILNLAIISNSGHGEAYHPLRLLRFDHLWHWGEASLRTHQELITVITTLASKATRNDMLQKINLKAVLAGEGSDLTQDSLDRLTRYYTE